MGRVIYGSALLVTIFILLNLSVLLTQKGVPSAMTSTPTHGAPLSPPLQQPQSFIDDFISLNSPASHERSKDAIIFRGNNQGLGNNILQFMAAIIVSVCMKRSFRYHWQHAAQVPDITELISLPVSPTILRWPDSESVPTGACEWNLGCCPGDPGRASPQCWTGLGCLPLPNNSPALAQCPNLTISSNVYYATMISLNPHLQSRLQSYFPSTNSMIGHLSSAFLAPAPAVMERIKQHLSHHFPVISLKEVLGVHVRSFYVRTDATIPAVDCVQQIFNSGVWKYIFLATDNITVRADFKAAFGEKLLTLNLPLADSMENENIRQATVATAWDEAVILSRLPAKILSLQHSTFSHVIYAMSSVESIAFDLGTCSQYHSPTRSFFTWMSPSPCPPFAEHDSNALSGCIGRFAL